MATVRSAHPPVTTRFSAPTSVAIGDFNEDGHPDVCVPNSYTSSAISVLIGNGDGTYKAPVTYNIPNAPFDVEVGDFNHYGHQDIADKSGSGHEIQLGKGDGTFYPSTHYAGPSSPSDTETVGDFNGDGADDLVSPTYLGTVSVMVNANNDRAALSTALGFSITTPASITANAALPMTVTAVDADGNAVTDFTGTVYFGSSDPQMKAPSASYTFTAADAGTHVFTRAEVLSTVGAQTVSVSAPFMTTATANVTVTPAITRLVISAPTTITAGAPATITVSAMDNLGNLGTLYTGTINFSSSDVQAGLPADYTITAADAGMRTFQVTLKTAQLQSVTVTDAVSPAMTATTGNIDVTAGAPVGFQFATPSKITAGTAFTLKVTVVDAYGNKVKNYAGTLHFSTSAASAVLPADYVFNAADAGVHSFLVTVNTSGNQTLTATDTRDSLIKSTVSISVATTSGGGGGGTTTTPPPTTSGGSGGGSGGDSGGGSGGGGGGGGKRTV